MNCPAISGYELFSPAAYLREYYSVLGEENRFLMEFYHRTYAALGPVSRVLEIGGGPTLYQLISASRHAEEIVFSDFLAANRTEIENWIAGASGSFSWDAYFRLVAEMETGSPKTAEALKRRLRGAISRVVDCDLRREEPVALNRGEAFDVVSSAFCIECVAEDSVALFLSRLRPLLRAEGVLVLTTIRNCTSYRVGPELYPAQSLDEPSLRVMLEEAGFDSVAIETLPAVGDQGYDGIMAVTARRRDERA